MLYWLSYSRSPGGLTVSGIEGAFDGPGSKTVIPRSVTGKFSIRLVPDMEVNKTYQCVKEHLEKLQKERGSPNPVK